MLPPHIILRKINNMPEGPKKEKKLKWFHIQMKVVGICLLLQFAGIVAILVMVGLMIVG